MMLQIRMVLHWFTCTCVYICICVCIYICIYIYIHICVYICKHIYTYIYIYIKFVTPVVSYTRSILPCKRALPYWRKSPANTSQHTATHCNTLHTQKSTALPAKEPCRHGAISRRAGRNQILINLVLCSCPCRALFVYIEGLYMARGCHRDMALLLGEQGNGTLHCRALLVYM